MFRFERDDIVAGRAVRQFDRLVDRGYGVGGLRPVRQVPHFDRMVGQRDEQPGKKIVARVRFQRWRPEFASRVLPVRRSRRERHRVGTGVNELPFEVVRRDDAHHSIAVPRSFVSAARVFFFYFPTLETISFLCPSIVIIVRYHSTGGRASRRTVDQTTVSILS